ncbi:hypothetical protein BD413DRAFT_608560 [Trametes elegans]|nr:hypothetical protein BD413DRAFT_608560 [Trametes elegans]
MAAVLSPHHSYSPHPARGILLNPSPAASPAYHSASLPILAPSNSSLSSSASSSSPADDYFSSKSSSSASPSPGPSSSPAPRSSSHPHPSGRTRNGSNPSTVRRIRFAPLPEPRRDLEPADVPLPPVFLDDESDAAHSHEHQSVSLSSALAAASFSLAATGDSDLCRRSRSLPSSVTSSPFNAKKPLPGDSLLDPSLAPSSTASDSNDPDSRLPSAQSELGQEWDVLPPASPGLPALALPLNAPDSPRKAHKWSKMLKPLLGRSSASSGTKLTRTMSVESTSSCDLQRGRSSGGLRLGLTGSRNSSKSRETSVITREADFGLPLHRSTSEGQPAHPAPKKKKHSLFGGSSGGGVPLGRTQSLTSLSSKEDRKARKAAVANGGRREQRMLNGRVYGAKRNQNPFANVRSEEPEFVEWGYGGMGSVKSSAGQSEIWSRVQKGTVAIGGDDSSSWGTPKTSMDEDDGSGMTWLKKRREQREREKKEREEREKAEAAAKESEEPAEAQGEVQSKPEAETASPAPEAAPATANENASVTPTPAAPTPMLTEEPKELKAQPSQTHDEHITQTVNIPAPAPHLRHHHSHSHSHAPSHSHHHTHGHGHSLSLSLPHPERRESADTARGIPYAAALTPSVVTTPTGREEHSDDSQGTPVLSGARLRTESGQSEGGESLSSSAASTASETSDDVDDSEDSPRDPESGFGEDEDEEEDELLQEQSRRTALGAGVEKIARHKEHEHEQSASAEAEALST